MADKIKIKTYYEAVVFFETSEDYDEQQTARALNIHVRSATPDSADYTFQPGSPASSPYCTVSGPSKPDVLKLTRKIMNVLKSLGSYNITT